MAVRMPKREPVVTLSLAAIVLAAFALRAYGVGFGLPHLYYWDEPTVVNRAVRFEQAGTSIPTSSTTRRSTCTCSSR